jgi:hypothetical protein
MPLVDVLHPCQRPWRRPLEQVVVGVLDQSPRHELVAVEDVDPASARLVRGLGDRTGERRVLDVAVDVEVLALAEVQANADCELRVPPEKIF